MVVCTEPRRLAATSIADRVSKEMDGNVTTVLSRHDLIPSSQSIWEEKSDTLSVSKSSLLLKSPSSST